jgi:electron transport complex protein RnfE
VLDAALDGLMMGVGFTLALVAIGGVREVFGSGTLFANAHLLLGPAFSFLETTIVPEYKGFLLMILPPGGFMVVGLLLAGKRVLDARRAARAAVSATEAAAAS